MRFAPPFCCVGRHPRTWLNLWCILDTIGHVTHHPNDRICDAHDRAIRG